MTLTVGRVTGLHPDRDWERDGDFITLSGVFDTAVYRDEAEVDVRRMQVVNLANNPDEEFVPVRWASDPSIDGFYRVVDASVSALGPVRNGAGRWSLTLERSYNAANPRMETVYMAAVRANGLSITSTSSGALGAVPSIADTADIDTSNSQGSAGNFAIRACIGGNVLAARLSTLSAALRGSVLFSAGPGESAVGGCLVEQRIGSNWYPVVGRQPFGPLREWRISNGIVRLGTAPVAGPLSFELWRADTQTWNAVELVSTLFGISTAGASSVRANLSVIRNDDDAAVVRCDLGTSAETFAIRRGVTFAEIDSHSGLLPDLGFSTPTASAPLATATMGLRSGDINGDRFILASNQPVTNNVTTGTITRSGSGPGTYLVGAIYKGSAAAAPYTQAEVIADMFTAVWAKTRLVVR